ncbi:MAG TPA: hopanoid biosynthesis-associated protein HpnK [Candidatus Baltobacteraceae bacterium]|jgi:hopanoid biosynthesis associated protein HpnK|nr:hopanoid biosynthesis-associated protein HpnK [Candidatus Baltobacteraceae bacterium]
MRQLIVTADDFGLSAAVNEAIELGHREGILSTTSLMVAAPATHDAVERARRTPSLRVGLHVVLVNGRPALAPERVPLLVDERGLFESDLLRAGVRYFFTPGIRAQLEAEIRAQFAAFAATELPLDHVNAQNHLHVHPTVLSLILKVGREYGMRAIRIPREPFWPSWRAMRTHAAARFANAAFLLPWLSLMRLRLRLAGIATNDYVFGMIDTGHMTPERVRRYLQHLPNGVSELYVHPATHTWPEAFPPDYDFAGEFAALIDPQAVEFVRKSGLRATTFSDLAAAGA